MSAIQRTLTAAQRRLFYQHCLRNLGWAVLAALLVAIGLVAAERLLGSRVPWWVFAGQGLLAAVAAVVVAGLHFPSTKHAAAQVDERLKLKDRLATSLYVQNAPADPFTPLVLSDAEQAAGGVSLAAAFPIRLTRVWGYVLPAAAVTAALWLWLPNDLLGRQQALARQARIAQRQAASAAAAQENIVKVVEAIRQTKNSQKPADLDPETAKALNQLVEMSKRELTDPQGARTAVGKLAEAREAVSRLAESKENEVRPLQNLLSKMEVKESGPADKFVQALQRGDFEQAQADWDQLAKGLESASPEEQAALAKQLGQMASQLSGGQNPANNGAATQPALAGGQQPAGTQPASVAVNSPGAQTQPTSAAANAPGAQTQPSLASGQQNPSTQPNLASGSQPPQPQPQPANTASSQRPGQQDLPLPGQAKNGPRPGQGLAQNLNQVGQGAGRASTQPGGQPGNMTQQAAGQVSQQLGQLAQAQRDAQQLRQGQNQLQQAMRNLPGLGQQPGGMQPGGMQPGGNQGNTQANGTTGNMSPTPSGPGGRLGGKGAAPYLFGKEQAPTVAQTEVHKEIDQSAGRVIAAWKSDDGQMAKGPPTVEFTNAVAAAQNDAVKAITEERMSKRYQKAIREYFDGFAPTAPAGSPAPTNSPAMPPAKTP